MKTIVQFDLIRANENVYFADPNSLYVFGFINLNMLNDLLTSHDYLSEMVEDMPLHTPKTITMNVWEDSDDYRSWLDYSLLPDDFDLPLPTLNNQPCQP